MRVMLIGSGGREHAIAVVRLARDLRADLVFVAPDDPLAWGLVDALGSAGIAAFGPSRAAARLEAVDADVLVFHAGTRRREDGTLVTAGGRVLGVTATGPTLQAARAKAHDNVARISFEGAHYRRDIGLEGKG